MCSLAILAYACCLPGRLFSTSFSTVIEDREGLLLGARIATDGQWRFPEPDSLPEKYVQALLTFEDKRFFYHPGVDPLAFGRAIYQNLRRRRVVSGGSTLSMQVIRLSRNGKPRSIREKIIEIILATRLELRFSKERILRLYAAHAPYGGNVVGIEAASWRYFGKPPHYMSWAEAALLAILPNSPGLIHPGRNRQSLLSKRDKLLKKLYEEDKIDLLTLDLALSESLPEAPLPLPNLAPHLLQRAVSKAPGKRTITSLEGSLQARALEIADRHHSLLRFNGIHNLAALIVHVPTGKVLAYVGNAPQAGNAHGEQVDVVIAPRSTGSILKPFLYALALQEGLILPGSFLPDIPMNINGYHPENFQQDYDGLVPADIALSRSLNIPFVHLLRQYGVGRFHYQLRKLGLSTISRSPDHYGLTLVLGGAEATLWDLAEVYAGMARTLNTFNQQNSRYLQHDSRPLSFFKSLAEGTSPAGQPTRTAPLLDAGVLWHTFQAMQEVNRPETEGDWQYFSSSRRIAWKTGTSFGFRDAWAIGLTPEYLVATWVGNADGEGRPDLIGTKVAAPLMFELFQLLPPGTWFSTPFDELIRGAVCSESGWPAGRYCPSDTLLLQKKSTQAQACRFHQLVHLNPEKSFQVHANCRQPGDILHESWLVLPALEEFYFRKKHPDYQPLPPFHPDCAEGSAQSGSTSPMQLIYPAANAKIYIPRDLDGSLSATVFKLAHRNPDARVFWHLDNMYLGTTQTFHHLELQPTPGPHVLTLVDAYGNRMESRFTILEKK